MELLNGRMAEWRNGGIGGTIDSGEMAGWPESLPTYLIYGTRRRLYLFSTFARTYFVVLHVVQKLLGGRRTYPPF